MFVHRPLQIVPLALWLVIMVFGGFAGASCALAILFAANGVEKWYVSLIVTAALAHLNLCLWLWFRGSQITIHHASLYVLGAGTLLCALLWAIRPASIPNSLTFFNTFFLPLIALMQISLMVAIVAVAKFSSNPDSSSEVP